MHRPHFDTVWRCAVAVSSRTFRRALRSCTLVVHMVMVLYCGWQRNVHQRSYHGAPPCTQIVANSTENKQRNALPKFRKNVPKLHAESPTCWQRCFRALYRKHQSALFQICFAGHDGPCDRTVWRHSALHALGPCDEPCDDIGPTFFLKSNFNVTFL